MLIIEVNNHFLSEFDAYSIGFEAEYYKPGQKSVSVEVPDPRENLLLLFFQIVM